MKGSSHWCVRTKRNQKEMMKTTSPLFSLSAPTCPVTHWWHNSVACTCFIHTRGLQTEDFRSRHRAGHPAAAGRLTASHRRPQREHTPRGRGACEARPLTTKKTKRSDHDADSAPLWRGWLGLWSRYRTARSKRAGFFRGSVRVLRHAFNQSRRRLLPLRTRSRAAPPPLALWWCQWCNAELEGRWVRKFLPPNKTTTNTEVTW